MEIVTVNTRRLVGEYIDLPWKIYRDDPNWVPPLKREMRSTMSREKNPFHAHAEVEHFVAKGAGGETLGRIAACVYPVEGGARQTDAGTFGFFESVDDEGVARALLRAAEGWAAARGMTRMSGPYNYCATQEMGLLIEGFDHPPAIFQTHNPPYYPRLLEACGYAPEFEMTTHRLNLPAFYGGELCHLLEKRGDKVMRDKNLTVRGFDLGRYWEEMRLLLKLFNRSFAQNAAVLPVTEDVFEYQAKAMKPFMDSRLLQFVYHEGEPIAFVLLMHNLNELLIKMNGRIGLLDLLLLKRNMSKIKSAVILLIGAVPEHQGAGTGRVLISQLLRLGRGSNREWMHTTWVHDGNWSPKSLMSKVGFEQNKRYCIVGRRL